MEVLAPGMERIASTDLTVEHPGDGYGGPNGHAEGPVWWKDGGYLLFSDITTTGS